jgi:PilZ domain-containing protein
MGRRVEPRKQVQVPVRIFGTDSAGAVFSQKAVTVNVSHTGVELAAVNSQLAVDEIIGLTYGTNRVHFRVKWVGAPNTPRAGHVGLLNINPEKPLWDFPLPFPRLDPYQATFAERRAHPRFRCHNPVEIHIHNGPSFWGTVADLSLGGCYVEMPIPLDPGTKLRIGIWFGQSKAWAEGEVAHRTPGMGIGVKFIHIASIDLEQIQQFLQNVTPLARKRPIVTNAANPE